MDTKGETSYSVKVKGQDNYLTLQKKEDDAFCRSVYFNDVKIAETWSFDEYSFNAFAEAVISDPSFAIRFNFWNEESNKKNSFSRFIPPFSDSLEYGVIYDGVIEHMNSLIEAGVPKGISAFLALISIDFENKLQSDDILEIIKAGIAVQMDSATYSSTLEIFAVLQIFWERDVICYFIREFGNSLKNQENVLFMLGQISHKILESLHEPTSTLIHFISRYGQSMHSLRYNEGQISTVFTFVQQIKETDSYRIEKNEEELGRYVNDLNSIRLYSMKEKSKKESLQSFLEATGVNELSKDEEGLFDNLLSRLDIQNKYSSYSYYNRFLMVALLICFGMSKILETWDKYGKEIEDFPQLIALLEFEKDDKAAYPDLVFALHGLKND